MKIEHQRIEETTINKFADRHNLTMVVSERGENFRHLPRFYAHFKDADVKRNGFLVGEFGDGETEDEAIKSYAASISRRRLVIGARTDARREIEVPRLISEVL